MCSALKLKIFVEVKNFKLDFKHCSQFENIIKVKENRQNQKLKTNSDFRDAIDDFWSFDGLLKIKRNKDWAYQYSIPN